MFMLFSKSVGCTASGMLVSFGLIADIQYAEAENAMNYEETHHRYYRRSLVLLRKAVEDWKRNRVDFIVNLGDTIDGKNAELRSSLSSLKRILDEFSTCGVPVYHLWGNHELYNFSQEHLNKSLTMNPRLISGTDTPKDSCSYTHFSPCKNLRIILLDSYDVSILGRPDDDPSYIEAKKIMERNPNEDKNSPMGLVGRDARFVMFNGGISAKQLTWLDGILDSADRDNEDVLIFGHTALEAIEYICLCWNYEEVLRILHKHDCVLSYISGHVHHFYECRDSKGVHHITLPGIVEVPLDVAYGHSRVGVYEDKIVVHGNQLMHEAIINRPRRC